MKKIILSVFIIAGLVFSSTPALAQSITDLQAQIQVLLQQIQQIQTQIDTQQTTTSSTAPTTAVISQSTTFSHCWNTDLFFGMANNSDVLALQQALTLEGVYSGPITGNFFDLTRAGVIAFQTKYNFDPIPTTGYVGSFTRQTLNNIYCGQSAQVQTLSDSTTQTTVVKKAVSLYGDDIYNNANYPYFSGFSVAGEFVTPLDGQTQSSSPIIFKINASSNTDQIRIQRNLSFAGGSDPVYGGGKLQFFLSETSPGVWESQPVYFAPGTYSFNARGWSGDQGITFDALTFSVTDGATPLPISSVNEAEGLMAVVFVPGQLTLDWQPILFTFGYNLHRSTVSGFIPNSSNLIAQPSSPRYTDVSVSSGTHYYKAVAKDSNGNTQPASPELKVSFSPITTTPTTVTQPTTTTTNNQVLNVSLSSDTTASLANNVNAIAGVASFTFTKFVLDANASGGDIQVTSIAPVLTFTPTGSADELTNCQLYDGATALNTGIRTVNPFVNDASRVQKNFVFDSPLTVPSGTMKVLDLKCNVDPATTNGVVWQWGLSFKDSNVAPAIFVPDASVKVSYANDFGRKVTASVSGSLELGLDASSPAAASYAAGTKNVTATVLRFDGMGEAIRLDLLSLQFDGSNLNALDTFSVWDGNTKIASVARSAFSNNLVAIPFINNAPIIPKDGTKLLTIKVDISSAAQSGDTIALNYDGNAIKGTVGVGLTSGVSIVSSAVTDTAVNNITIAAPPASGITDTDLKITNATKASFHPYGFYLTLCVDGSKSINDLKQENPGLSSFPIHYIVYEANGQQRTPFNTSAVGGIENIKNGTCNNVGIVIQNQDQAAFDQSQKVDFVIDKNNLITETNENNNLITYQGASPTIIQPINNSKAYVTQLFPGQFDNTKYSLTVEDPEGVSEFLLNKANGSSIYGGNPNCFTKVTSSTITLLKSDFPLSGYVIDCKDKAVKHTIGVSSLSVSAPLSVDLKVNGSDTPSAVSYDAEFTVSWKSNGDFCSPSGHFITASDGGIWTDNKNLAPSGSRLLKARHNTYGYISPLEMTIQCDRAAEVKGASDKVSLSVIAQPVSGTNNTDLELKSVIKGDFHTYGFFIEVCMRGSKSINDLKLTNLSLKGFPWHYSVYNGAGQLSGSFGADAGGGIENLKDGSCLKLGTTIQASDQPAFDKASSVVFALDKNNLITETNEFNNEFTWGKELPLSTTDTDLKITNATKASFHKYGFLLSVCMDGSKSINDLKQTNSAVTNFPIHYIVYEANGQPRVASNISASGSIENLKNGSCFNNLGTIIQSKDQSSFDQSQKVTFVLDQNALISESNENNNKLTWTSGSVAEAESNNLTSMASVLDTLQALIDEIAASIANL